MNGLLALFRPKRSDWFKGLLQAEEQVALGNKSTLEMYLLCLGSADDYDEGIENYLDHYETFLEEPEEELPDAVSPPYCRNPMPV